MVNLIENPTTQEQKWLTEKTISFTHAPRGALYKTVVHHLRKTKDILIFVFAFIVVSALAYMIFLFFYVQKRYAETPENGRTLISETKVEENKIPAWQIDLDTILEKNNPKNLDLSKHQLFIDTTRNSENFEKLINWKPNRRDNDAISYREKEIAKKYKPLKIDLKQFPKHWISLKKLNNEFVIYEPCDRNTTAFEINESSVLFFYQLEPDVDLISKLIKITYNEISLGLRTIPQKKATERNELTIKPTEFENVYVLTYSFGKWYVTPKEKVSEFDIVINHCPTMKRMEFNGFDKE